MITEQSISDAIFRQHDETGRMPDFVFMNPLDLLRFGYECGLSVFRTLDVKPCGNPFVAPGRILFTQPEVPA